MWRERGGMEGGNSEHNILVHLSLFLTSLIIKQWLFHTLLRVIIDG